MASYREVKVEPKYVRYLKATVNGHEFELFNEFMTASKEWYVGIVGTLPKYLESEHKKPMLCGRGTTEEGALQAAKDFLAKTFPAWPADKLEAWKKKQAEVEAEKKAAAEKAAAAKKAAAGAAARPAGAAKPAADAAKPAADAAKPAADAAKPAADAAKPA